MQMTIFVIDVAGEKARVAVARLHVENSIQTMKKMISAKSLSLKVANNAIMIEDWG